MLTKAPFVSAQRASINNAGNRVVGFSALRKMAVKWRLSKGKASKARSMSSGSSRAAALGEGKRDGGGGVGGELGWKLAEKKTERGSTTGKLY